MSDLISSIYGHSKSKPKPAIELVDYKITIEGPSGPYTITIKFPEGYIGRITHTVSEAVKQYQDEVKLEIEAMA